MNTYSIYVTSNSSTVSADNVVYLPESTVKGGGLLNFNLSGISQTAKIRRFFINYGDNSTTETYTRSILTDSIPLSYKHNFLPSANAYFLQLSTVIVAYYENDVMVNFVIPFKVAQASLYDDIDNLYINTTQLLPTNNTLINFTGNTSQYTFIGVLCN